MNEPIVAVDVDGVLADLVGGVCRDLRETHSWLPLTPEDVTDYDFSKCLSKEASKAVFETMGRPGFAYSLEVYPGALDMLEAIRKAGFRPVALTSPYEGSDTWIPERLAWLRERVGIGPRDVVSCPTEHKKHFAAHALIEDNPATVRAWVGWNIGNAFLVDRPWTRRAVNCPGHIRTMNLQDIAGRFAARPTVAR